MHHVVIVDSHVCITVPIFLARKRKRHAAPGVANNRGAAAADTATGAVASNPARTAAVAAADSGEADLDVVGAVEEEELPARVPSGRRARLDPELTEAVKSAAVTMRKEYRNQRDLVCTMNTLGSAVLEMMQRMEDKARPPQRRLRIVEDSDMEV